MGFNLRKKLNDTWSGADFWQGEENKRQRQKAVAPARTVSQPKKTAPATTQRRIDDSYGTGFSGLGNKIKDNFVADSKADKIRRFATTGLDESYDQEQARKTTEAMNSNDKLSSAQQVLKSVPAGFANFLGKAPGSVAQLQGRVNSIENPIVRTAAQLTVPGSQGGIFVNKKNAAKQISGGQNMNKTLDNKMQQSSFGDRADDNQMITGTGKMFGQLAGQIATGGTASSVIVGSEMAADEANRAQAAGKTNDQALAIGTLQGGLGALSERYGVDKFLPGKGNVGGNMLTRAGKRFLTESGQEAEQQYVQNLISNKTYNPNQGLTEGVLQSAVMGGIAGGVMSPAVDLANRPKPTTKLVSNKPAPTQPTAPTPRVNLRPNEGNSLSDFQDVLTGREKNVKTINAINKEAYQSARRAGVDITSGTSADIQDRINQVLEQPQNNKRFFKPLNDGGYVQVPGGKNSGLNDTELSTINYINNKPTVKGSATQGEGNALPSDQPTPRRQELLDRMKKLTKPMNEGGYIQVPGGKDVDPLESLKQDFPEIVTESSYKNPNTGETVNPIDYEASYKNYLTETKNRGGKPLSEADYNSKLQSAYQNTQPPKSTPNLETPLAKSNRLHEEKLAKNNLTQNEYAGLYDKATELDRKASELHRKVGDAMEKARQEANGKPFTPKVRKELRAMADEWSNALDAHVEALNVVRKIDGEKLIPTSKPSTPKTVEAKPTVERETAQQRVQPPVSQSKSNVVPSSKGTPKSRFAQRASTSEEISPELQTQIKNQNTTYEKQTNKEQLKKSTTLVNKGYKVAASNVSARLDNKNSGTDAQTVSDAIAVIKRLDQNGSDTSHQQASELVDKLSERLTEAGQTVQAASLLYGRTPQGLYYSARRTLKKAGVELTPKLDAELQTLLKEVKSTKADSPEGQLARFKFIEKVNKSVPSGNADKAVQIWKAGLLSGPITQVGNITANTLEQSVKRLYEDPIATGADIIMSAFTGKRSKVLTGRGLVGGVGEGAAKGISYFKTGFDPRNPSSKFDVRNIHYSDTKLGRLAEAYTQTIFKSMGTADQPFYYASMRNSLYDQAITDATNLKLKGDAKNQHIKKFITEPSKKALQLADTEARYDVFQNKTKLGEAASGLKGRTGAVGDFFIPFSGVPSSIATRIVERTPLGTALEVTRQMKAGKFDQRRMSQAIARGTTGVVLVGIGRALAESDLLTLGFPKDNEEKKLWEVEGRQPYSVRIGDKWVSLNYFQPAGTLMAAGGEYSAAKKDGANESEAWSRSVASAGKALTEQSFLKGVSGALNAVTEPSRFGEMFLENTVGSTVPNWLRAPTRALDPQDRQVNNAFESLKAGVPGARQTLDSKVGTFGEDKKRKTSAINSLINPGRPSDVKPGDNTTKELRRLQDAGQGIMPSDINRKSMGEPPLTDRQVSELERKVLPDVKSAWDTIIADPRYQSLDDEGKRKALRSGMETVSAVRKKEYAAKNQIREYSPDYTGKEKKMTAAQRKYSTTGDVAIKTSSSSSNSYESKPYKERYEDLKSELADSGSSLSDVQRIRKDKQLNKLNVQKDYPDQVNDLYYLSKADINKYVTSQKDGDKLSKQLIALDNALYNAGAVAYRKFKNGIAPSSRRAGGGRGKKGGKKGKYDYTKDLFASGSGGSDSNTKALRKILEDAMSGRLA